MRATSCRTMPSIPSLVLDQSFKYGGVLASQYSGEERTLCCVRVWPPNQFFKMAALLAEPPASAGIINVRANQMDILYKEVNDISDRFPGLHGLLLHEQVMSMYKVRVLTQTRLPCRCVDYF